MTRLVDGSRFAPTITTTVHGRREDKIYECRILPAHFLVQAINESCPHQATSFAVNVGAGDGVSCHDPVYPLFQKGYGGLAIEGAENGELHRNLPSSNIQKRTGTFATPANIDSILRSGSCPMNFDFLKIDIDGFDGVILKAILERRYLPKVIQIEINPDFPPPVEFCVLYDSRYRWTDDKGLVGGFYGASLAFVANLAQRFGYRLVDINFVTEFTHDAVLVREEFLGIAEEIYGPQAHPGNAREMYLAHPPGYSHFQEYGIDVFPWRYRTDYHEALSAIWFACMIANAKKHGGVGVPFQLSLGIEASSGSL